MEILCDELNSMNLLNNFGLNLCIMPPMSHMVVISEDGLIRKKEVKYVAIDIRDLVSTLVNY